MKIFLTGANGFIGSHLKKRLVDEGHEVETDLARLFPALVIADYDMIIHLAAKTHIRSEFDAELFNSNILFANKIMTRPHRLIYASSCSAAYMTNPYAYTKRYNEYLGEQHGNALGLRFHNVYGPNNNKGLIKYLMDSEEGRLTIRGPQLIRDYIYIDDVVDLITKSISWEVSGVIDVGTGIGTKTIDVVNLFQEVSGKKFILDFAEHGHGEPGIMVSNNKFKFYTSLEQGIKKTLQCSLQKKS